jgi:glycosyltransferase 2 family protein
MTSLKHYLKPRYLVWIFLIPTLWWVLRSTPLADMGSVLGRLTLIQILALVGINIIILITFTSRWWVVLRTLGYRLPFLSVVGYRLAGFGLSYFTPGPQFGGEPLQVHLLRHRHSVPASSAIAAVSLDKLFELLVNFSFLVFGILVILRGRLFQDYLTLPLIPLAVLFLMLPTAYLIGLGTGRKPFSWLSQRAASRLAAKPSIQRTLQTLVSSEEHMVRFCHGRPSTLLKILAISLFPWLLVIAEYRLTLLFLGQSLDTYQIISLLAAARVAFLLPSPGGLGTLEASQVLMMQAFGLNPALGIGVSLLIRGRDLALGSLGLWLGAYLSKNQAPDGLPSTAGD